MLRTIMIGTILAVLLILPVAADAQLNVTLLSNKDDKPVNNYNDCWGYSAGGREYAIIGYTAGTLFYDVTVPTAPVLVGDVVGVNSVWRDMKTNGTYCYIVTEGGGGGMQVVDLSFLPDSVSLVNKVAAFTAHNIYVDTGTQRAYVCGIGNTTRIYDVGANAVSPPLLGSYSDLYIHDLFVQGDTMYCGNISNSKFTILDARNVGAIDTLAAVSYGHSSHATWLLEGDNSILLTADEESGGIIRAWDISNYASITELGSYASGSGTSVHNIFSIGDNVYSSYYTEGLRIANFTDPTSPVEVGSYDTFPGSGLFDGAWGCYPFLPSGTIIISDVATGLYLLDFTAPGVIAGTVSDTGSTPVALADVSVPSEPSNAVTNSAGGYVLTSSPGTPSVITSAFGFVSDTTAVSVSAGVTTTHDVGLVPLPGSSILGIVSASGGGGVLENADVTIIGEARSDLSDAGGEYQLDFIPAGVHLVAASLFGYDPDTVQVTVVDGVPQIADFSLIPWFLTLRMEDGENRGWTRIAPDDDATTGIWIRRDPNGTGGGQVQTEDDHTPDPGFKCYVTGNAAPGSSIGLDDVDGGKTTLFTKVYDLTSLTNPEIIYHRWFSNNAGANPNIEPFVVHISNDSGSTWATVESTTVNENFWKEIRFKVSDFVTPTSEVQVRFIARDNIGAIIEAAIDDFGIRGDVVTGIAGSEDVVPTGVLRLAKNRPNPFNPTTTIDFTIPAKGKVNLSIYDPAGRLVRTLVKGSMNEGQHSVNWTGLDNKNHAVASGVYFYRLDTGKDKVTRKLTLIR